MRSFHKTESVFLWTVAVLAIAFRLLYLTGPLDESSWRQAWCAYQARELARENPPQFFYPKINYKGTNDVSVWNLPVYEGVVALAYKSVGVEECLPTARFVSLLFFVGSACFLGLAISLLTGRRAGFYSALVYLLLPLGLFYSRAVHYDVAVLFFCHAFFYTGLKFLDTRKWTYYALATVMAATAFSM